jgi:UTP-glucose-1-phosphate uridylyltransferase
MFFRFNRIIDILSRMNRKNIKSGGELELWDALEVQLKVEGLDAATVEGDSTDIGSPEGYLKAFNLLAE